MKPGVLCMVLLIAGGCSPSPPLLPSPDTDADGVPDERDNCVESFNPTQYDRDGDGKGHACDLNVYLRAGTFDPLAEPESYLPDLTTDQETGYYFVQFASGAGEREVEPRLAELEIEIVDYFDGHVAVVRTPRSLDELRSEPWVRAAGIYQPANRVAPDLMAGRFLRADGTALPDLGTLELEVWVYRDPEGVARAIRRLGGTAQVVTEALLTVQLPGELLPELLFLPDLNLAMPRAIARAESDYVSQVTGAAALRRARGLTGAGEVITIADSGIDSGDPATMHPDLASSIVGVEDWGTGTAIDLTGHGTHVAGIAAGRGSASGGRLLGAAPGASLRFQAIGRPTLGDGPREAEATFCFGKQKASLRAKRAERSTRGPMRLEGLPADYTRLFAGSLIHSNSWGSCQGEYTPRVGEIDRYLVDHPGVTVLVAAGNDANHLFLGEDGSLMRRGGDSLTNTARAKNVITVGASGTGRAEAAPPLGPEGVAPFSGKGDSSSGRIKPDLVAPGVWVLAPRSRACLDGEETTTLVGEEVVKVKAGFTHEECVGLGLAERVGLPELGGEYMLKSGTSMATPHVAGLVALLREWFARERAYRSPSGALIKAVLIHGAVDLPDQGAGLRQPLQKPADCTGYPNPCEGWGRVDIEASLEPAGDGRLLGWVDRVPLRQPGEVRTFTVQFEPGARAALTLVWTDPPPQTLHNDLDLSVQGPDGARYLGNTFGPGTALSVPDPIVKDPRLNNNVVERVIIEAASAGSYRVEVSAARLRSAPQPFALVASPAKALE